MKINVAFANGGIAFSEESVVFSRIYEAPEDGHDIIVMKRGVDIRREIYHNAKVSPEISMGHEISLFYMDVS